MQDLTVIPEETTEIYIEFDNNLVTQMQGNVSRNIRDIHS